MINIYKTERSRKAFGTYNFHKFSSGRQELVYVPNGHLQNLTLSEHLYSIKARRSFSATPFYN